MHVIFLEYQLSPRTYVLVTFSRTGEPILLFFAYYINAPIIILITKRVHARRASTRLNLQYNNAFT